MASTATSRTRVQANSKLTDEEKALLEQYRSGHLQVVPDHHEEDEKREEKDGEGTHGPALALGFILDPSQIASVEQGRGRKPVDQAYLKDVQEMKNSPGTYAGYRITDANPPALITSKIRRAARELGLGTADYSVYVREKEGFVSFTVHASAASATANSG